MWVRVPPPAQHRFPAKAAKTQLAKQQPRCSRRGCLLQPYCNASAEGFFEGAGGAVLHVGEHISGLPPFRRAALPLSVACSCSICVTASSRGRSSSSPSAMASRTRVDLLDVRLGGFARVPEGWIHHFDSASSSENCSLLYLYSLTLRIMPSPPPRLLSGSVVRSGQETYVEGEGLWLADYDGGEVGVGRVQEVVAFALYDDARNLEHGASLAPDPFVAYA